MKRTIVLPLSFALLALAGCDTEDQDVDAQDPQAEDEQADDDPNQDQPDAELIPIADPGVALDGLIASCTLNSLTFDFLDGSGSTGPDLALYPPRAVVGDSLVFEQNTIGAVGGRPYLFGTMTLTLLGEDPQTGEWVVAGAIEGPDSTVLMEPLRVDPNGLADLYPLIVEADNDPNIEVWDLVTTAPAAFSGAVNDDPFAYELRWHLGYNSLSGVGYGPCDEKAGL